MARARPVSEQIRRGWGPGRGMTINLRGRRDVVALSALFAAAECQGCLEDYFGLSCRMALTAISGPLPVPAGAVLPGMQTSDVRRRWELQPPTRCTWWGIAACAWGDIATAQPAGKSATWNGESRGRLGGQGKWQMAYGGARDEARIFWMASSSAAETRVVAGAATQRGHCGRDLPFTQVLANEARRRHPRHGSWSPQPATWPNGGRDLPYVLPLVATSSTSRPRS